MEATEVITSEVHKRIRDLDVDPRVDVARSREVIRTVISEYDERSLTANLPPLEDREATFRFIDHQLSGFGLYRTISKIRASRRFGSTPPARSSSPSTELTS